MDIFSPFWISIIIFSVSLIWILSEKIHRSIVAFFGALCMVVVGTTLGFYSLSDVSQSIDYNTLLLLGGMMIIVAILEKTGVFEYLAIKIAQKTHGNYWLLLISLWAMTALLSMVLDNVSTIILIAPMTIIIAKILHYNPIPLLIGEAILSNIWGIGTLVWDPTAILIGSAAGFSFLEFSLHAIPVVICVWIWALLYLLKHAPYESKLQPRYRHKLMELHAKKSLKNTQILKKWLWILALTIIGFFCHDFLDIPPSLVALFWAACILMLVAPHDNPQKYLKKLELSVFLFFTSLFVLVGWLESAGVLHYLGELIAEWVEKNIVITALIILWSTAIISSIVDNIPMTIAMIPIIKYFESQGIFWSEILWWALVFWVGFWGNMTPFGSTANVVVMAKLELAGKKIHTKDWLKVWIPIVGISLSIVSIILTLFGNYFM